MDKPHQKTRIAEERGGWRGSTPLASIITPSLRPSFKAFDGFAAIGKRCSLVSPQPYIVLFKQSILTAIGTFRSGLQLRQLMLTRYTAGFFFVCLVHDYNSDKPC